VQTADDNLIQIAREKGLLPDVSRDDNLSTDVLGRAVAGEFGLGWVNLESLTLTPEVLAAVPPSFAREQGVMPFASREGVLHVAVSDPRAMEVLDRLAFVTGRAIVPALAAVADIQGAIARYYSGAVAEAGEDLPAEVTPASDAPSLESRGEEGQVSERDAPLIRLVQAIITEGIRRRASDIHLEPLERRFRVRYRIDGVLLEADAPPQRLQAAIVSRLKIMADISIAEKRLPQDGRIRIQSHGLPLDLRVSSLPTVHGESIVMRILDQEQLKLGLPELGFWPDDQQEVERQITSPDGIVLVTGPTGSGKTTTLYSCLHHLNQSGRKIITVEDPVEYQISGINQVPVNASIGLTFAAALRAMLRQAPNVVMVGEIRDRETAEIALNASLTGHLVFSTLHTNDAPSAVTRLIDIGTKPFLVAAALRASVAQRLVRRICPHCRRAHMPSVSELHALGLSPAQLAGAEFAHGAGCAACHGTGYRGRLGLFEIFLITDEIRTLVHERASAGRLRESARRAGGRTLREDGLRKVLAGQTTIAEVVSATVGDGP
jgi:general secretion pathway protein E/type IV pilus assembly protein PilB